MKSVVRIIFITIMAHMIVGCADHRLDGMVDDKVYLLNYNLQNINVFNFGEYTSNVVICKGGIGTVAADVELELDQEVMIRYNNLNGTSYKMLPSQCYELSANKFHLNPGDVRQIMIIKYHTNAMANLPDKNNYVIPLQMKVGEGTEFDEAKQTLLVRPVFIDPVIFFPKSGTPAEVPIRASGDITAASFEVGINYRNLIEPYVWDISFELEPDPAMLASYNASTGKNYRMLPADAYSLNSDAWTIAKTKILKDVPVQLFKKKLVNASGEYQFGDYALPVKISRVSKWGIDSKRNNLLLLVPFYPSAFDASGWLVLDWNSCITMDEGQEGSTKTPYGMLTGTGWQSKWNAPLPALPYHFVFDMRTPKIITQINLRFPTGTDAWRGNLRSGTFEISNDNVNWTKIADWNRGTNNTPRLYECPIEPANQVKARYLRFVIDRAINYYQNGEGAQMDVQQLEVIGYE